jgi:hypothetical protein
MMMMRRRRRRMTMVMVMVTILVMMMMTRRRIMMMTTTMPPPLLAGPSRGCVSCASLGWGEHSTTNAAGQCVCKEPFAADPARWVPWGGDEGGG